MASIRDLKDEINAITHELVNECYMYRHFHPEKDSEANKVMSEVLKKRDELIFRTNNPGDTNSGKIKAYYSKIREDLKGMSTMLDKLSKS